MSAAFVERGGLWVLAQFAFMTAVAGLGVFCPGQRRPVLLTWLAALLAAASAVLGLSAVAVLGRNRTPFPKPRPGACLVQRGIYARVRHPLYTSVMCLGLAWALWRVSLPALVAALLLLPFFRAKSRHEERWLQTQFPGYTDYARRVPGFIPRLRRPAGAADAATGLGDCQPPGQGHVEGQSCS